MKITEILQKNAEAAKKYIDDALSGSIKKALDSIPSSNTNQLQRNKEYKVGDIAYSPNLPSWAYLECVTAGTTGSTEPDFSSVSSTGGQ